MGDSMTKGSFSIFYKFLCIKMHSVWWFWISSTENLGLQATEDLDMNFKNK